MNRHLLSIRTAAIIATVLWTAACSGPAVTARPKLLSPDLAQVDPGGAEMARLHWEDLQDSAQPIPAGLTFEFCTGRYVECFDGTQDADRID